jgi:hypothetical protein
MSRLQWRHDDNDDGGGDDDDDVLQLLLAFWATPKCISLLLTLDSATTG